MYAYADQNFLSTCADNPVWRDAVVRARDTDTATLVLSPWHSYELGNAQEDRRERLIQLAEDARPAWVYSQVDLQMRELFSVWNEFWGNRHATFQPICTLPEAAAALHDVHPRQVENITLREWVSGFVADALIELQGTIDAVIGRAVDTNQRAYQQGRMTKQMLAQTDLRHVAVQFARRELRGRVKDANERAEELLRTQPIATEIEVFVYWRGMDRLKSYQVESALAANIWESDARFRLNRFIDRQHATVALPYCDFFVTDDRDLIRRCEVAKQAVNFTTAEIIRGEPFIKWLSTHTP